MAGVYLTSNDYPSVRIALDPALTATGLPDSVIGNDIYAGRAENEVVAKLKSPSSLTDAQEGLVKRACILRCAAYIARRLRQILQNTLGDFAERREQKDYMALSQMLLLESDEQIEGLVKTERSGTTLNLFGLAEGRRGR